MSYTQLRIREDVRAEWDQLKREVEYKAGDYFPHSEILSALIACCDISAVIDELRRKHDARAQEAYSALTRGD